jgi:hypothetical protein
MRPAISMTALRGCECCIDRSEGAINNTFNLQCAQLLLQEWSKLYNRSQTQYTKHFSDSVMTAAWSSMANKAIQNVKGSVFSFDPAMALLTFSFFNVLTFLRPTQSLGPCAGRTWHYAYMLIDRITELSLSAWLAGCTVFQRFLESVFLRKQAARLCLSMSRAFGRAG